MEIVKIFNFEGSHIVRNCSSHRCSHSVHGHSYKVEVAFEASKLDNAQMVMDFGLMKGAIKAFIDSMDHCHVICSADSHDYVEFFQKHNDRWIMVPFNPSAEMLSVFILKFCQHIVNHTYMNNGESSDLKVSSVTVWETATGRAKATLEDLKTMWNELWWVGIQFSDGVLKDWPKDLKNLIINNGPDLNNPKIKPQISLPSVH